MTGIDCRLIVSGIGSFIALSFAHPALAACTSPAGAEGDQFYNTTHDVMQFCNGSDQWVNMGAPAGASVTDEVGAVTNNKWCRGDGAQVVCDQDPPGGGASGNIQNFDSSGTWNKPASGTMAMIECWGGGGSGARYAAGSMGGGGGGGGYNVKWVPLSDMGATETVTVGAGGAARSGSDQAGATGGTSSVGAHLTAYGGAGGTSSRGGGGGGLTGAGSGETPGTPLLISIWHDDGVFLYEGQGARASPVRAAMTGWYHGGGGGTYYTGSEAGLSVYGGGGGGGRWGTAGSVQGTHYMPGAVSTYGGAGGAGATALNGTATSGTQPGGGGGGCFGTCTSGAGAAGRCKVTVF